MLFMAVLTPKIEQLTGFWMHFFNVSVSSVPLRYAITYTKQCQHRHTCRNIQCVYLVLDLKDYLVRELKLSPVFMRVRELK